MSGQHPAQPESDVRFRLRSRWITGGGAGYWRRLFHGKSMKNYETITEEETLRETATTARTGSRNAAVNDAYHANAILRADLRGRR